MSVHVRSRRREAVPTEGSGPDGKEGTGWREQSRNKGEYTSAQAALSNARGFSTLRRREAGPDGERSRSRRGGAGKLDVVTAPIKEIKTCSSQRNVPTGESPHHRVEPVGIQGPARRPPAGTGVRAGCAQRQRPQPNRNLRPAPPVPCRNRIARPGRESKSRPALAAARAHAGAVQSVVPSLAPLR